MNSFTFLHVDLREFMHMDILYNELTHIPAYAWASRYNAFIHIPYAKILWGPHAGMSIYLSAWI